jgi:glycosyltransferase involved in cell wall biosynthesis
MGWLFSSNAPTALLFRPVYRMLQRKACRDSSVTVFQNEEDRRAFLENGIVPPGRDRLVRGSGIDLAALERRRPDTAALERLRQELGLAGRRVVIMISRLVAQKGIREYLAAAAGVCARRDDVVFLLAGASTKGERGSIEAEEVRRLAGNQAIYLGQRDDVPALLAVSDLFVLPSYYREGVPRVLLEAGAAGLPLIAADVPGSRDVVREGWNGLLVPPRDDVALAAAMVKLLDDPAMRAEMGARARARVREEFTLERVAGEYAAIYRSILEGGLPA